MKKLVLLSLSFYLALAAFGQKPKHANNADKISQQNSNGRPYSFIIVNGTKYEGSLNKMVGAKISGIRILHDTLVNICPGCYRSTMLLITTKGYKPKNKAGTNAETRTIYMLNGDMVEDVRPYLPGGANAGDVLSTVYFNDDRSTGPDSSGKYAAYAIVTKQFAREQYQKKIGAYSYDYRVYLNKHDNNDTAVYYAVDGTFVGLDRLAQPALLHAVPEDNINMVLFTETYMDKGKNCTVCFISTKKK